MFNLGISTDGAAFEDDPALELARILANLAAVVQEAGGDRRTGTVRDINGNTVGSWSLS